VTDVERHRRAFEDFRHEQRHRCGQQTEADGGARIRAAVASGALIALFEAEETVRGHRIS
jgi:hypothetical protein